jgi:hypothetical protein
MANEEYLSILKSGVSTWNKWRFEHREIIPDLREADLFKANLREADLFKANLREADLRWADLCRADLSEAILIDANLFEADLREANLREAVLSGAALIGANLLRVALSKANLREAVLNGAALIVADLSGATLIGAKLRGADLSMADLRAAALREANLIEANLIGANLSGADLSDSTMGYTSVADIDLSEVKGLETVRHFGPSSIGIDTIYRSKAMIPEVFLRGAGVPDDFITYMKSLVGNPIEFCSCFISYSSKDEDFAKRLYADLRHEHVRCWFAPEDLKIGDRFRPRIDEAIRVYDKLLLILSKNSIHSTWVEREVETAFEKERKQDRIVLFPIRLDDAVMETDQAWAADIRRTSHIGDFRSWKNHDEYKKAFDRLLRDLKAEDKPKMAPKKGPRS